jgi:tetratricopeptide (TPR) repeat protein
LVSRLPSRPGNTPKTLATTKTRNPILEARRIHLRAIRPWVPRPDRAVEAPRYAAIAFFVGLALFTHTQAATPEAEARFGEARVAFEAQDFSTALALYEQALALGLDGPAVHYNIGVAAYRSGALDRAERAFREVARTPAMAALAHYNLGLVSLQRGDQKEARRDFELAARDAGDERLAALAAQRLEELPPAPPPVAWSLYARTGAGYDGNVALRSDSIDSSGSGEDDAFAELLLSASSSFASNWRADAAIALLNYGDLDEFDQGVFSLGAARGFAPGGWYVEPGIYANYLTLGGDVYEQSATASVRASRKFPGGRRLQAWLGATAVDGEGDFSGLSGSRTNLGVRYEWSWQAWSFTAHARAEDNDSDDEVFATSWAELGASAEWSLTTRWSFTAAAAQRRTDDEDRRGTYRLGAIGKYWKQGQIFIRYEHERNASPIDAYEYDRNWAGASIEFWY